VVANFQVALIRFFYFSWLNAQDNLFHAWNDSEIRTNFLRRAFWFTG